MPASSSSKSKVHYDDYASAPRRTPTVHSASSSHVENEKYMKTFQEGFEALQGQSSSSVQKNKIPSKIKLMQNIKIQKPLLSSTTGWETGPTNAAGTLISVSNQPLVCQSIVNNIAVVGSSDHALYVVDISKGRVIRKLYAKKYGHAEWITAVLHLPDGRVVSGGMDSKICVWNSTATGVPSPICIDLLGHVGSISLLDHIGSMIISASYDKTIRCWQSSGKKSFTDSVVLKGHGAPILAMAVTESGCVASGARNGEVRVWDINTQKSIRNVSSAHDGHVTALLWDREESNTFVWSGGQDGCVKQWDVRARAPIQSLPLHQNSAGRGALAEMQYTSSGKLVTAGADGILHVIDPRVASKPLFRFTEHGDFIYSLHVKNELIFSGASDGMLHVHDASLGKLLYGLGANQAAVRCIGTTKEHLIAAGDDGTVLVYNMP